MTDDDLAAALIAIWFLLSLLPYLFFFGGGKGADGVEAGDGSGNGFTSTDTHC